MLKCMLRYFLLIIGFMFFGMESSKAQFRKIYDGPYVTVKEDVCEVQWIEKGRRKTEEYPLGLAGKFKVEGLPEVDLNDLGIHRDDQFEFNGVEKFTAISDVHGQFSVLKKLLMTHGITDSIGNWSYGKGHLVIVGDIFDRGDKVTECLWFIFKLEQQALRKGGRVHFLLGNHELMVMHGDKSYINPKYIYTAGKLRKDYYELFSENTVLGHWIRSKKVSISINDMVFVHGGFSKRVLDRESSIERINNIFKDRIIPDNNIQEDSTDFASLLYFENGPLWYRRYAQPYNFDIEQADYILSKLGKETIVIGHTSMPQIIALYGNRVILIDSSIKFGKTGEMLIYEDETLYRAKFNGDKLVLYDQTRNDQDRSLFDYLLEVTGDDLDLHVETEFDSIIMNKEIEEYYDATLTIFESEQELYKFEGRVRTRGNMRKQLCELPPLKLDFNKRYLRTYGFSSSDKVKLILPCLDDNTKYDNLYKEQLIYELYRKLDTLGLRTKLIPMAFTLGEDSLQHYPVLLIEDDDQLAARINGDVVETGIIQQEGLDRDRFLRLAFFQFMISNNDWAVSSRHNLMTIKLPDYDRLIPIPYDFDYAGIINQEYSASASSFPRMTLDDRKLRIRKLEEGELERVIEFYFDNKSLIMKTIDSANYMSKNARQEFKKAVEEYYKILARPYKLPAYLPGVQVR